MLKQVWKNYVDYLDTRSEDKQMFIFMMMVFSVLVVTLVAFLLLPTIMTLLLIASPILFILWTFIDAQLKTKKNT